MSEQFELRYVQGQVEVYDGSGEFCFSADTWSEAESELNEMFFATVAKVFWGAFFGAKSFPMSPPQRWGRFLEDYSLMPKAKSMVA